MSLDDPSDSDSVRHVRAGTKFKRTRIDDTRSKSTPTKRRESTWKVDGESTGVFSKLKLLEHELLNLEKVMKDELSKVPLLMRKQAKRHQALAGKMNDLCKRMVKPFFVLFLSKPFFVFLILIVSILCLFVVGLSLFNLDNSFV
ncbi:hypothetical protein QJS04_geneDACA013360 [Acorus gramineus]|uniref:Uncharacterized protein n=1 Tax=Acorus gramineus TaxID=55184 RepID=A0AAV9AAC9_ACOGR|nr:hypothetical protein QJS04_geneDACA013360 [Acorus gramineus]